jgi:hypothetical protein
MNPRYIPVAIAIALPFLFLIALTIAIYLPNIGIKPAHDFIYTSELPARFDGFTHHYEVVDNQIASRVVIPEDVADVEPYLDPTYPILYRYDIETNTAKVITLEEAQALTVEPGPSSPDGYTVTFEYGHNGIFELFGSSGSDSGYVIMKGNGKKMLPGITMNDYWRGSIEVVGWVIN